MTGNLLKIRITAAAAALLIAFGAAGCTGNSPSDASRTTPAATTSQTPPESLSESGGESLPDVLTRESEEPSETIPERESAEQTAEPTAETVCEPTVESSQSEPAPAQDEPQPEQTTTAQTTTTATAATTAKPAAPVVIPEVKTVSSPGTAAVCENGGTVDYSNAEKGYISVYYTGSSDKAKLRLICGDAVNDHTITVGKAEYIPLSLGSGAYTAELYERVDGKMYAEVLSASFDAQILDPVGMYLYPNKYCDFNRDSDCVRKGAELCAGIDGEVEKIAAVFGWVTENVSYDYALAGSVTANYVPFPDSTLAARTGICFDYAALFAAMTRSQGIPTRIVIGYSKDVYHAWNEVWTEETGWITPELLLGKKGYNRVDATFYSTGADKAAISDYITNNGNYSAVYYY